MSYKSIPFKGISSFFSFVTGPTYIYNDMYTDFTWSTLDYGCSGDITYDWDIDITLDVPAQFINLSSDPTATLDGAIVPNNVPTVFLRCETTCASSGEIHEDIEPLTNWSGQNFKKEDVIEVRQSLNSLLNFDL